MGTIAVLIVLSAVTLLIIRKLIRDKKAGKSLSCGGDCARCMSGCGQHQKEKEKQA